MAQGFKSYVEGLGFRVYRVECRIQFMQWRSGLGCRVLFVTGGPGGGGGGGPWRKGSPSSNPPKPKDLQHSTPKP